MVGFILGTLLGGTAGVGIMCIMTVAKEESKND